MKVNRLRLEQHFKALSQYDKLGETGVCHPALSPIEKEAFGVICQWMIEAGISVKIDDFGKLIEHLIGKIEGAPILIQPYEGRFDGIE